MKKMNKRKAIAFLILALTILLMLSTITIAIAQAETVSYAVPLPEEIAREQITEAADPEARTQPFTWAYLASIAGSTAFTLLFVQFFKVPLDKVWKIPTRVFVYIVSLAVMLIATLFTSGLTLESAALAACNALLAAFAAYGAYEVTFAKQNHKT